METVRVDSDEFVPIGEAIEILSELGATVSIATLRRWGKQGKLQVFRTTSNQRRFRRADLEKLADELAHLVVEQPSAS